MGGFRSCAVKSTRAIGFTQVAAGVERRIFRKKQLPDAFRCLHLESSGFILFLLMRLDLAAFAYGLILARPLGRCGASFERFVLSVVLGVLAAGSVGCQSATVTNESRPPAVQPDVATTAPEFVYIGDFDLGATTVQAEHKLHLLGLFHRSQDPAQEVAKLQDLLANGIVSDLNRAGMPASRLEADAPRPTNGWLVTGEFLELKEGNRAERAVVGFGAGDSSAKLYVTLADLAHPEGQNLLDFNTNTNGEKTPGGSVMAVAEHSPWGIVAKYVIGRNASEKDMKEIAKAIADEVVKFAGGKQRK